MKPNATKAALRKRVFAATVLAFTMKRFLAVFASLCLCSPLLCAQATATAGRTCPVDRTPPIDGDLLLGRDKDKEAQAAYQAVLQTKPMDENARLGVIRAMIGQNQVAEAKSAAAAFAKEQPNSGLAQVAASEADYRAGDIDDSFAHAKQALILAPCEGRAAMALAQLYDLTGLHANAARFIVRAHRLRPMDQFVTREWIGSLPRKERLLELSNFLQSGPALSDDENRGLNTEKQYLEARKPGECHTVSTSESTQTPLSLVYGDSTRPVAYGLDVLLNGKHRRTQIDTGASGIVLSDGAARGLGLEEEYKAKSSGVGDEGERESYLAHVHSLRIGAIELQDCMVQVVKKSGLHVDGLIGMDVFRRWLVTLDYPAGQLRLAPLPRDAQSKSNDTNESGPEEDEGPHDSYVAPEMQGWLRIARVGHNLLLPAALNPTGKLHYVIMDTGAQSSLFSLSLAKETGKLHSSAMQFSGISGKTKTVFETNDTEFFVGNLRLPKDSYYATDVTNISHNLGFEIGGLFGLPTLQRLTIQIDYRDNLLKLSYDPKHDQLRF